MGFSQAPGLPYSKLGIPEDGDAASRAISKGKYVIWKGKNYFAKTDILQGETFVEDTNLTEIPEGAINGIVDALNASLTTVDLLVRSTTSGSAAFSLSNSLANYKFIYYTLEYTDGDTDLLNPVLIPVSLFRTRGKVRASYYAGGGTTLGPAILTYVDDNSVKIQNFSCYSILYGIK